MPIFKGYFVEKEPEKETEEERSEGQEGTWERGARALRISA